MPNEIAVAPSEHRGLLATMGSAIKAAVGSSVPYNIGSWGGGYATGDRYLQGAVGGRRDLDFHALSGDLLNNSVIATGVSHLSRALNEAPPVLQEKQGGEWKAIEHDAINLLQHPAPKDERTFTGAHLWGYTAAFETTRGQGFWLIEKDSRGLPANIRVDLQNLEPIGSGSKLIDHYKTWVNGKEQEFGVAQIIHFRESLHYWNPRKGYTPLETGRREVVTSGGLSTHYASLLENAAMMSLFVSAREGGNNVTPEQFNVFLDNLRTHYSGGGTGRVGGTNLPLEVQKIAYSLDEMGAPAIRDHVETTLCALMGIHPMVLGLISGEQHKTYNNIAECLEDFWLRRIVPHKNRQAAELTTQYLPLWGLDTTKYRIAWDYSNVPALQENKDALHARAREDYKAGAMDLKQYRVVVGYASPNEADEARYEGVFFQQPKAEESGGQSSQDSANVATKAFEEADHPRAENGQFGAGGGASETRTPAPELSAVAQRAQKSAKITDKAIQRYSEEHNEPQFAKAVGGVSLPDSEPIDVMVPGPNGVLAHGVEIKTVLDSSRGRIDMNSYAQVRKIDWEERQKPAVLHTVVIDDQEVYNANGEGKHDESKRVYYYRRGVAGSAFLHTMEKCDSMEQVQTLMATPEADLPKGAQRTDGKLRKGKWVEIADEKGKGFRNSETGKEVRPKK